MLFSEACDLLICEVHVHWPSRSKGLHSRSVYESLHKNVFLGERLDLECLSSCRRRNEYQQFVGQPELQKHWILRGIQQQVTAVAPHLRRLRVR